MAQPGQRKTRAGQQRAASILARMELYEPSEHEAKEEPACSSVKAPVAISAVEPGPAMPA